MRIFFCQCWSKVCKIRIKSFGYKVGIFNFSAVNQISGSPASPLEFKSCLIIFQHVYMCVSMHTHTVVCKYVCMYHCFKMKRYEFSYVFVREARSPRPDTGHIGGTGT